MTGRTVGCVLGAGLGPRERLVRSVVRGVAAVACLAGVPAVVQAQEAEKPRLETLRVGGELLAGTYAGIGGYLAGSFVAKQTATLIGAESEATLYRAKFVGGVIGGGLATAGVVYGIGSIGDQAGDFDATYLGTGIGFVAGLGLAKMILGPEGRPRQGMSTKARWATANVIALLPAIGATIAFNSTRRIQ